ncbi:hypothetical protein WN943_025351 [Citrus x changshan-huyou]|uniref:Uncharacterized protein n=2 Tax=Citrus TaxID=2706 RepID=A0A067DKI7_CITSI|nr:hypothetical protein CISIN_1g035065mg [Citrus sinensis]KDO39107.1 hypothetical protein CISIN_1g035065mg [Citrus sinensis]
MPLIQAPPLDQRFLDGHSAYFVVSVAFLVISNFVLKDLQLNGRGIRNNGSNMIYLCNAMSIGDQNDNEGQLCFC